MRWWASPAAAWCRPRWRPGILALPLSFVGHDATTGAVTWIGPPSPPGAAFCWSTIVVPAAIRCIAARAVAVRRGPRMPDLGRRARSRHGPSLAGSVASDARAVPAAVGTRRGDANRPRREIFPDPQRPRALRHRSSLWALTRRLLADIAAGRELPRLPLERAVLISALPKRNEPGSPRRSPPRRTGTCRWNAAQKPPPRTNPPSRCTRRRPQPAGAARISLNATAGQAIRICSPCRTPDRDLVAGGRRPGLDHWRSRATKIGRPPNPVIPP